MWVCMTSTHGTTPASRLPHGIEFGRVMSSEGSLIRCTHARCTHASGLGGSSEYFQYYRTMDSPFSPPRRCVCKKTPSLHCFIEPLFPILAPNPRERKPQAKQERHQQTPSNRYRLCRQYNTSSVYGLLDCIFTADTRTVNENDRQRQAHLKT